MHYIVAPVGEQVTKRSCAFCQHEDREIYEEVMLSGDMTAKQLDKEMGWRTNTSDRHFRNHMGDYHMAANPSCVICSHVERSDFEHRYFTDGSESEKIAGELGIEESTVFHHMKFHFQPLVQRSAATEVAIQVGAEMNVLRNNVEKLNNRLNEFLDETTIHEDGFVRDAVGLHKEVRESIKDLLKMDEQWGTKKDTPQINQTINVLKVELSKESPDTWRRIRETLLSQEAEEL